MKPFLLTVSRAYIPEALALFARMTTPPTDARKRLINTAIKTMIASGAWAGLDAIWFTAAADSQAARLNWKSSSYTLTATNSPTFTADRGFAGDGTTSYLDTSYNVIGLTGSNHTGAVWVNVDGADNGFALGQQSGVAIQVNNSGVMTVQEGSNTTLAVSNGLGFSGYTRTGTTAFTVQKNAAQSGKSSVTASWTSGFTELMLAERTLANSASGFTTSRVAAAAIGPGLSDPQLSSVYSAMSSYLSAIGGA